MSVYIKIMSVNVESVTGLMSRPYFSDIDFIDKKTYDQAVSFGFDTVKWQKKNSPSKVKVAGTCIIS